MYHNTFTQTVETATFKQKRKFLLPAIGLTLIVGLAALVFYGIQSGAFFAEESPSLARNGASNGAASSNEEANRSPVQRQIQTDTQAQASTGTNGQTETLVASQSANNFSRFDRGFDVPGRVVPVQKAELSTTRSGIVAEVYIQEGDQVDAGQVLMKLSSANEEAEVLRAEARLEQAKANLERLRNSVRPSELLGAQASVDAAKARLAQIQNGVAPGALAAAEAQVASSEAARQRLYQGPNPAAVAAAQAELQAVQQFRDDAQRAYDQVSWRNDIGTLPESANLQRATNSYNAAKARLDALYVGVTDADNAQATANLERSQAELSALSASLPAQQKEAEANLRLYEAQLLRLQEGPSPEEIAVAEAEIRGAEALVNMARAALFDTELRAPFSGVIAILDADVGEFVAPARSVIRLADVTEWEIETSNLSELDILGITTGEQVTLSFDAFPDEVLNGVVKHVRPFGESATRETVYKVVITPDVFDNRFLWNMSAYITFEKAEAN